MACIGAVGFRVQGFGSRFSPTATAAETEGDRGWREVSGREDQERAESSEEVPAEEWEGNCGWGMGEGGGTRG